MWWLSACLLSPACAMVCTGAGCVSGLELLFDRELATDAVVRVELEGGAPWIIDCSEQPCGSRIFLTGLFVDRVRISITEGGVEVVRTVEPGYEEWQPNGPDCDPTCHVAEVSIVLR